MTLFKEGKHVYLPISKISGFIIALRFVNVAYILAIIRRKLKTLGLDGIVMVVDFHNGSDPFLLVLFLQPKTPSAPSEQTGGSRTIFVGNLSFSVEQADV